MNLTIRFREAWQATAHKLLLEVEQWVKTINRAWRAQHADDGTHGVVTATQVVVGTTTPGSGDVIAHATSGQANLFAGDRDATLGKRVRCGYDFSGDYGILNAYDDATNAYKPLRINGSVVRFGIGSTEFVEIADPDAPATNEARLYVKDNGAGKTQLCVRFATGAVQVIATEP